MHAFDRLLEWFAANARALPWRTEPREPYHVLVSEAMLQQTQVERVAPRFAEFLRRFPSLEALAEADEAEVVAAWSGLGYYRRARLLHRTARSAAALGGLPDTAAELSRLPGVGPYTAAAVASLAFERPEPVLDGNVLRVGARVLALDRDPRSADGRRLILAWVGRGMAGRSPGSVNEALMELGATVCTPRGPACGGCPFGGICSARRLGKPEAYPPVRRTRPREDHRWVASCARAPNGRWLLRRVDQGPILRGLWLPAVADLADGDAPAEAARGLLPPEVAGGSAVVLGVVHHGITHRRIRVVAVLTEAPGEPHLGDGWRWADPLRPGLPTSSLLAKLVALQTE